MRRIVCILIFFILIPFSAISENGLIFSDDTGEEIYLSKKPESTAVLFSSFAEMWLLSGGKISATVAESVERGFAVGEIPLVDHGAGKRIDAEKLSLCDVDLIIGSSDIPAHAEARESLRAMGVPFALFRVESIEDYIRVFEIMTKINQDEDAFLLYGQTVFSDSMKIIQKAETYKNDNPQKVLFIRSGSGYSSAKAKTKDMHFAAKMLDELGAENIADDIPVIIDGLSFEEIYMKDPDAIFVTLMGNEEASRNYMESLFSQKEWKMLKAIRNNRCYFLPRELFQFKPNQKWSTAYEELAKMLYPEWSEE